MPTVDAVVSCPVFDSFRVQQVAGMFDVPLAERAEEHFTVEMPELPDNWQIGLVVGPSGSGKTTIARKLFGEQYYEAGCWPSDSAVIDGVGGSSIQQATGLFTAVGFSSPPSWVKPYQALSNGEQFRCDLARALASASQENQADDVVVFDEYTSVVDRRVAQFGSAAVAKGIRRGTIGVRLVAVTCHYDVEAWLEPDWVLDMATGEFHRRRLRRPQLELALHRCHRRMWERFKRHHYLSGGLSTAARCHVAMWECRPVSFCATLPLVGRRGRRRISRLVTLPDYQGMGIGMRVAEAVGELHRAAGYRLSITASHPAVIAHCRRATSWVAVNQMKSGSRSGFVPNYRSSAGRSVVSFEYVGTERVDGRKATALSTERSEEGAGMRDSGRRRDAGSRRPVRRMRAEHHQADSPAGPGVSQGTRTCTQPTRGDTTTENPFGE